MERSIQQHLRDRNWKGGYWKLKCIRVMTSYHEDPTKRFYKYVDRKIWIPTREATLMKEEWKRQKEEQESKITIRVIIHNKTVQFRFSKRYPSIWK